MSSEWVVEKFEELVYTNMKMPVGQLLQNVDQQFNCEITRNKGCKALAIAKANIRGLTVEKYSLIGKYAAKLHKTHPNTAIDIRYSPRPDPQSNLKFMWLYCCLGALKNGIKEGCRPLIALDMCHTRRPYPDQLLTAIGADPNNG